VLVVDGEVKLSLPSDRYTWDGPAVGVAAGHAMPARFLNDEQLIDVNRQIVRFVEQLDIRTGPLYFQFKVTSAGPRIIEVAPRLDGCHLWRLIEIRHGFNIL